MNGNELSFAYDFANRLISAGQNSYTYNVEDVRVRNLCGESETTYAYNTNGRLSQLLVKTTDGVIMTIECRNNTSLRYFYAKLKIWHQIFFENLSIFIAMKLIQNRRAILYSRFYRLVENSKSFRHSIIIITKYVYGIGLIGEETSGSFKTYHFDYRGSTAAITDINGNVTDTFEYDTYGNLVSRTGTSAVIFLYNGRDGVVTDSNGLIYMRARYYSPELRRFINADIIAGNISDSVTLNRYAYANGNPVSNIDPFGLSAERGQETSVNQSNTSIIEDLARLLIGNPVNNWFTKNGWFEDLFRLAGFVRTKDSQGTYVYHATMDCLQRFGGYNSFYDLIFDYATSMNNAIFEFSSGEENYRLWAWKGDYLNLGAGAEMGIYKQLEIVGYDTPQWLVDRDLSMHMTLDLEYKGETIISWDPKKDKNYDWNKVWWVTGFNPYVTNVKAKDLTATYSVTFNNQTMYNDFYNKFGLSKIDKDTRWSFNSETNTAMFKF